MFGHTHTNTLLPHTHAYAHTTRCLKHVRNIFPPKNLKNLREFQPHLKKYRSSVGLFYSNNMAAAQQKLCMPSFLHLTIASSQILFLVAFHQKSQILLLEASHQKSQKPSRISTTFGKKSVFGWFLLRGRGVGVGVEWVIGDLLQTGLGPPGTCIGPPGVRTGT